MPPMNRLTLAERVNDALAPLARELAASDAALDNAAHAAAAALAGPVATRRIRIVRDDQPMSPRSDIENLGTMVCWHRRYRLGDVQSPAAEPADWLIELLAEEPEAIFLRLYLFDHSGISISTGAFGDRWDSGQVGWIYATPAKIREWFQVPEVTPEIAARATAALEAEVKVYDQFLRGDVWGYVIETVTPCACERERVTHEDSCFGFFGDDESALAGIRESIPADLHAALAAAWAERR